jgi:hypothetical protein
MISYELTRVALMYTHVRTYLRLSSALYMESSVCLMGGAMRLLSGRYSYSSLSALSAAMSDSYDPCDTPAG